MPKRLIEDYVRQEMVPLDSRNADAPFGRGRGNHGCPKLRGSWHDGLRYLLNPSFVLRRRAVVARRKMTFAVGAGSRRASDDNGEECVSHVSALGRSDKKHRDPSRMMVLLSWRIYEITV